MNSNQTRIEIDFFLFQQYHLCQEFYNVSGKNICIVTYCYSLPVTPFELLNQVRKLVNQHRMEVVAKIVGDLILLIKSIIDLIRVELNGLLINSFGINFTELVKL